MHESTDEATDAALLDQLSALLSALLKRPIPRLTRATTAADVDGWDSLVMLSFMFEVETHFGVTFGSGEMDRFQNVGDLVAALRARDLAVRRATTG